MRLNRSMTVLAVMVGLLGGNPSSSSAQQRHIMQRSRQSETAKSEASGARQGTEKAPAKFPKLEVYYHGGPLLPKPHIYAIYWGNPKKFPTDFIDGMNDFLGAYGGTTSSDIMTQYLASEGYPPAAPSFNPGSDAWQDVSKPPAKGKTSAIGNEACKLARIGGGPDPNAAYLVLTSNFPAGAKYCAWHSYWSCAYAPSINFPIVYLPNLNNIKGCYLGPGFTLSGVTNPYSDGLRSNANAAAHELAEIITDPLFNAWYDKKGNEIADKCNFKFVSPVSLNDGYSWQVQKLWSNKNQACIQTNS